jgi:hypothetical protein
MLVAPALGSQKCRNTAEDKGESSTIRPLGSRGSRHPTISRRISQNISLHLENVCDIA